MTARQRQRRSRSLFLFHLWVWKTPQRGALFSTTALLGGVGCSLLHAQNVAEAVFIYAVSYYVALVAMVPWYIADTRTRGIA